MPQRPQIQRILLEAVLPDGTPHTYVIDLSKQKLSALFWDDYGVKEVLAGHYAGKGKRISRAHLERHFPHVEHGIQGEDTELSPDLIAKIWDAPKADGSAVAFLAKDPECKVVNGF